MGTNNTWIMKITQYVKWVKISSFLLLPIWWRHFFCWGQHFCKSHNNREKYRKMTSHVIKWQHRGEFSPKFQDMFILPILSSAVNMKAFSSSKRELLAIFWFSLQYGKLKEISTFPWHKPHISTSTTPRSIKFSRITGNR